MNDLPARVAKLEKQNRWLRAVAIAALAVAIVPVFLGSRFAAEGDIVKAKSFAIIDDDGNARGFCGMSEKDDSVKFMMVKSPDRKGPSISFTVDKTDAMLGTAFDGDPNVILSGNTIGGFLYAKTGGKMKTAVTEE